LDAQGMNGVEQRAMTYELMDDLLAEGLMEEPDSDEDNE